MRNFATFQDRLNGNTFMGRRSSVPKVGDKYQSEIKIWPNPSTRAHMGIERYGTIFFSLTLCCTLASCATQNGMLRRANTALSPCVQKGQSRAEVRRCLQSADFADDHIHEQGNSLEATDCWAMLMPMMSACVVFYGDFDEQGLLTKWRLETYADGP